MDEDKTGENYEPRTDHFSICKFIGNSVWFVGKWNFILSIVLLLPFVEFNSRRGQQIVGDDMEIMIYPICRN